MAMRQRFQQTISRRVTLDEFLHFTAYGEVGPGERRSMQIALDFFQMHCPPGFLSAPESVQNPWVLRWQNRAEPQDTAADLQQVADLQEQQDRRAKRGKADPVRLHTIKLCTLMQSIDFTETVFPSVLSAGTILRCYRWRSDPYEPRPRGNFYTRTSPQSKLGLPESQSSRRTYRLTRSVHCLETTVSDAFSWLAVDANQARNEVFTDRYFHGGGRQLFIYDAAHCLTLVG